MRYRNFGRFIGISLLLSTGLVWRGAEDAAAGPAYTVPAQFIAKLYTESLGIAPPTSQWANLQNYYLANPCTAASLATWGKQVYKSTDFNWAYPIPDPSADKHVYASMTVALYRGALNREPTQAELSSATSGLTSAAQTHGAVQAAWNGVVDGAYGSSEFSTLAADICNGSASDPDPADYGWNESQVEPVASMPHGTTCGLGGPALTQQVLQAALDAAAPGGVVKLAQNAYVWLDEQLVVPEGVTVTTCGPADDPNLPDPSRRRYALQGRLIRTWTRNPSGPDTTWPYSTAGVDMFDLPTVRLLRGAKLDRVWVDGNRNSSENNCSYPGTPLHRRCSNVVMHYVDSSGSTLCPGQQPTDPPNCAMDTTVTDSRLDNSAGGTTLAHYGRAGGQPGLDGEHCRGDTFITNNLITAYQSSHQDGGWIDGMTVACEKSNIFENVVIDATDVPIIVWRPCVNTVYSSQETDCWNDWPDNRVQRTKVERNTIIAAGSSNWGSIWHTTGESIFADAPVADFTGATIKQNHIYTSVAATTHAFVVLGARLIARPPGTADWTTRGTGATVTDNDTAGQIAYVNVAAVISGMQQVTFKDNDFDRSRAAFAGVGGLTTAFTGWRCGAGWLTNNQRAPIIAEVSSGQGTYFWASGTLGPNLSTTTLDMGATYVESTPSGPQEWGCMRLDV